VEYVVAAVLAAVAFAAARLLGRPRERKRPNRTVVVDGIKIDVVIDGIGEVVWTAVLRVDRIPGQQFALLVAEDRTRLLVAIEPEDRVDLPTSIGGHLRAWSNDKALAHWWLSAPVCERLAAAGGWWSFRIADGKLEAHGRFPSVEAEREWMQAGLDATAALAARAAVLDAEIGKAREAIADTKVTLLLVQEDDGGVIKRIRTWTRFVASRVGQGPFILDPYLQGATRHLYEQLAPARVEADEEALRLDLEGVVTDPNRALRAAKLATRLAEPSVTPLDEGPYR
jgi:hypothetical protein